MQPRAIFPEQKTQLWKKEAITGTILSSWHTKQCTHIAMYRNSRGVSLYVARRWKYQISILISMCFTNTCSDTVLYASERLLSNPFVWCFCTALPRNEIICEWLDLCSEIFSEVFSTLCSSLVCSVKVTNYCSC